MGLSGKDILKGIVFLAALDAAEREQKRQQEEMIAKAIAEHERKKKGYSEPAPTGSTFAEDLAEVIPFLVKGAFNLVIHPIKTSREIGAFIKEEFNNDIKTMFPGKWKYIGYPFLYMYYGTYIFAASIGIGVASYGIGVASYHGVKKAAEHISASNHPLINQFKAASGVQASNTPYTPPALKTSPVTIKCKEDFSDCKFKEYAVTYIDMHATPEEKAQNNSYYACVKNAYASGFRSAALKNNKDFNANSIQASFQNLVSARVNRCKKEVVDGELEKESIIRLQEGITEASENLAAAVKFAGKDF